jgi:hypothetical protein
MTNFMLTLIAAESVHCGSTAETVMRDRFRLGKKGAVCCSPFPRSLMGGGYPGRQAPGTPDRGKGAEA